MKTCFMGSRRFVRFSPSLHQLEESSDKAFSAEHVTDSVIDLLVFFSRCMVSDPV
jgi:hypothetical protein